MKMILQVFYSIFSGLLLSLAIPNELFLLGSPLITLFAIIPYYIAIKNCKNYKTAFLLGFCQTITTHLASSFWLAFFKDFAALTLGASAAATGVLGGIFGLIFFIPYADRTNKQLYQNSLYRNLFDFPGFKALFFTIVYVFYEFMKSIGFLGYPWGTVSSAIFKWKILMQLSSITGTYGITFLIVLFNVLLVELIAILYNTNIIKTKMEHYYDLINLSTVYIILLLLTVIYGDYEYNKTRTPVKQLTTILIQQNADPWKLEDDDEILLASEKMACEEIEKLKEQNKKADLLVLSEGSLMHSFPSARHYYKRNPEDYPLIDFIKTNQLPLLSGGSFTKEIETSEDDYITKYFNSAVIFDKNGEYRGFYGKLHLVPFAEYVPGLENPVVRKFMKKIVGFAAGWSKGENITYFEIPCTNINDNSQEIINIVDCTTPYENQRMKEKQSTVKIAAPICFDDAFTDVMRPLSLNGAELFINLTDDSWSLKKSSEYQHFCIAAYRAIEYRTTLVRSTNAGYSVVVDPSGKILADLPLFEQASLCYDIPIYKENCTTYSKYGNWFVYICKILILLAGIYSFKNFKTTDYIKSERKRIKISKSEF